MTTQAGVGASSEHSSAHAPLTSARVLLGPRAPPDLGETWTSQKIGPSLALAPIAISPFRLDAGLALNLSTTASGGAPPYTFHWSGLPIGCSSVNRSAFSCRPSTPGNFSVIVNATDSSGGSSTSGPATVVVHRDPRMGTVATTRAVLSVGGTVVLTAAVYGGDGPGGWVWSGLPSGCATANSSRISCKPTASGSFSVHVVYSDLAGASTAGGVAVQVVPGPTVASFTASPSPNTTLSTPLTLTVNVVGGAPPLTYAYAGLPTGCSSANTSTLSCTPGAVGYYTVRVTVTDVDGEVASGALPLQVLKPGSSGNGPLGGLAPAAYVLFGLAVALLLVVVLVFLFRRRRSTTGSASDAARSSASPSSTATPAEPTWVPPAEDAPSPPPSSEPGVPEAGAPTTPPSSPPPRRRPPVALPPPTPLAPPRGDSVCVVCGGYGQIDSETGKYYCARCDRHY